MSRRKVQKVMPISAVASSRSVEVSQTNSILSDPDGRWVAERQGAINDGFESRVRGKSDLVDRAKIAVVDKPRDAGISDKTDGTLSGESERIGRTEWDENTPFGEHVGFL